MRPDTNSFRAAVWDIVSQIPCGRVLTYGRIAALAGWPCHARMVGRVLREVPPEAALPCHRVVNSSGRTAPQWPRQAMLLRAEGVPFRASGRVDLSRALWPLPDVR